MADAVPSAVAKGTPQAITLASDDFADGEVMQRMHTCDERNVSPPLKWRGVPDETAELVLVCEDPDDSQETFVHWMLAGIDPNRTELAAGEIPDHTSEGTNDFGVVGYRGPCPPHGSAMHRYVFRLIAVNEHLALDNGFSAEELRNRLQLNGVLAWGELIGMYGRTELGGAKITP